MKIMRLAGNEILEVARIGEVPALTDAREVVLAEAEARDGGYATPRSEDGFRMRYWRHYGPRAFDLQLLARFAPRGPGNTLRWSGHDIAEYRSVVEEALAASISWPIWRTSVDCTVEAELTFRIAAHRESLLLLFQAMVSELDVDTRAVR
ncbi:MAG: hypothetical protein HZA54_05475 [Planctomycetes bacterium]|nr:hypothetical protein [Planctomycetota bacterium]